MFRGWLFRRGIKAYLSPILDFFLFRLVGVTLVPIQLLNAKHTRRQALLSHAVTQSRMNEPPCVHVSRAESLWADTPHTIRLTYPGTSSCRAVPWNNFPRVGTPPPRPCPMLSINSYRNNSQSIKKPSENNEYGCMHRSNRIESESSVSIQQQQCTMAAARKVRWFVSTSLFQPQKAGRYLALCNISYLVLLGSHLNEQAHTGKT